ncbi:hypothetical protein Q1695_008927 [Nippostrongylus brasiliensis]|nr:hypothetical protein Q1695_008927 [Nippostrongylus brasiliensis]
MKPELQWGGKRGLRLKKPGEQARMEVSKQREDEHLLYKNCSKFIHDLTMFDYQNLWNQNLIEATKSVECTLFYCLHSEIITDTRTTSSHPAAAYTDYSAPHLGRHRLRLSAADSDTVVWM